MKKYETVAAALISDIKSGKYPRGSALPTEERLTLMYGVSRQTVRRALSVLAEGGMISTRRGSGSTVLPERSAPRTGKIAVVATYISDYIFPGQLQAVEEVLSENHCTAVLSATRNRICTERTILSALLSDPVDGILIEGTKSALPDPNADLYARLMKMGIPVVFFNGCPALPGTYSVCADNYAGGTELARHLVAKGHTNICGFFKSDDIQGHQRYSGFISELFRRGLIIPDENIFWYTTETKDALFSKPEEVLPRLKDCTAAVCYNDEAAFGLVKCLLAAGRRIPQDIAVASFDNSALSDISPVPITSLECCGNIGRIAAQKLVSLLNGEEISSGVVPWRLVQKSST